jgi:hypothetical protein
MQFLIKINPMYKITMNEFDQRKSYMGSYGVFCMAMSLPDRNERELDILWSDAIKMYEAFVVSDFNDYSKSELDCIHDYLMEISK